MIQIFKRRAWKKNPAYPGGYEPNQTARRYHIQYVDTVAEARLICREHNKKRVKKDEHFLEFTDCQ